MTCQSNSQGHGHDCLRKVTSARWRNVNYPASH